MEVSAGFKLSFGSVNLDSDDLNLLNNERWFNDKLLTFMGEFTMETANRKWKTLNFSRPGSFMHVFTPPETEVIKHSSSDEIEMFFGMLEVDQFPVVAFILNDNTRVHVAHGGSHWSLLVFDRRTDKFRHFDSVAGSNHDVAESLMKKAHHLVGQKRKQNTLNKEIVVQQNNSRDCGLMVAGYLWELAEKGDPCSICDMEYVKPRSFWFNLIMNHPRNNISTQ